MTPERICPAYALAHTAPDFVAGLLPAERLVLPHMAGVWLRPEQRFPRSDWRSLGFICGRGWGKSYTIALNINALVQAGEIKSIALMGPNADRVDEVQIEFLIETSPPWFKARRLNGTVVWPNGVIAEVFTPEAPGRPRSGNFDFAWLCEIVDWAPTTRAEAFQNVTTATRVGKARYVWDTTSKGSNEVLSALLASHAADPESNRIVSGETFDNPTFPEKYLRDVVRSYGPGQRAEEELRGRVFAKSAGALWAQTTIDANRRAVAPPADLVIVVIDPALTNTATSDEYGILVGSRDFGRHVNTLADLSGKYSPDAWTKLVVDRCELDAAGVVIETNHAGDFVAHAIMSEARTRKIEISKLTLSEPFPRRRPGMIYIREVHARDSKGARATGPAAESLAGRVHMVGHFPALEKELTTFEPGPGVKSPNRFDAHAHMVNELAELGHEDAGKRAKTDLVTAETMAAALRVGLVTSARGQRVGL